MNQQIGIALGTPVMPAVVTAVATASLLPGLRVALGVNAGIAVGAAAPIGVFLRPRNPSRRPPEPRAARAVPTAGCPQTLGEFRTYVLD